MFGFLDGKKSYLAGIGLMFLAVGTVLNGLFGDGGPVVWDAVFTQFLTGLGVFGLRHAVSKGG